jgi:hypothetical protein
VTLVIGGEDHRTVEPIQVLPSFHVNPCKDARQRQNPRGEAHPPQDTNRPPPIPRGKINGLADGVVERGRPAHQRFQIREAAGLGERRFIDRGLERVLERYHQLDTFERAQAKLVDRGISPQPSAARVSGEYGLERVAASGGCGGRA